MTANEIITNCNLIRDELDRQIPLSDMDSVEGKMLNLCAMMGLSAECLRYAQYLLLHKQGQCIDKIRAADPTIPASILKVKLESDLAEERTLYEYAERLNAAITHCVDGLRTSISKYKEELNVSTFQRK